MLDDIETGFEAILTPADESLPFQPTAEQPVGDEVRELFDQIAANYVRPVRQLMIELRLGDPPREWLGIVTPAMSSLRRSSEGMGLADMVTACDAFIVALDQASESDAARLGTAERDIIATAYEGLVRVMPEAFNLDNERQARDPIILQTLLLQVPGMGKVALDKIYDAGLNSLDMFMVAKAADLADATGIGPVLALAVETRFKTYREETAQLVPEEGDLSQRSKLEAIVADLEKHHKRYEALSQAWSAEAKEERKRVRAARNAAMLETTLIIARMGMVDLVKQLETLPYDKRLQTLWTTLEEARTR